jgi:hypothetical protein
MRNRSSSVLFLVPLALAILGPTARAQVEPMVGSPTMGRWTPPFPWPHVAIHMHLLPNGKVLTWAREADGSEPGHGIAPATVWDPASGTFTDVTYTVIDIFCTGHSFLADGRLFISGGHIVDGQGIPNTTLFDSATNTWTPGPQMNAGRWYPTNTTLANGDVLIVSGVNAGGTNNLPQVYEAASGTIRSLTSAVLGLPLYPRLFLAPDGRVVNVGPGQTTSYLDTSGTGLWTSFATSLWGYRDYGTAVLYDTGKILIAGGGDPPTATAEVIDLNAPTPAWRYTLSPMHYVRRQLNSTLLPDGKVLVTGGTSSPGFNNVAGKVLPAEIWDPVSETWTVVASMKVPRIYHGTTVLLPDARVLSSGSGRPPGSGGDFDHLDAEIFSPPYLFKADGKKAPRPKVSSAPSNVAYGESFFVATTQAAKIRKVSWLRISSTTHAFNMEQRINFLTFTKVAGGIQVTAPSNPNLSPPGYYMLFLINDVGTPSIAKIIRIG